jgi:hypothetical protein
MAKAASTAMSVKAERWYLRQACKSDIGVYKTDEELINS